MKKIVFFCLFILSSIGIGGCGSESSQLLSITECEAEGGTIVLSSIIENASCGSGQHSIGTIGVTNLTGICCK